LPDTCQGSGRKGLEGTNLIFITLAPEMRTASRMTGVQCPAQFFICPFFRIGFLKAKRNDSPHLAASFPGLVGISGSLGGGKRSKPKTRHVTIHRSVWRMSAKGQHATISDLTGNVCP
jgi:hypothetical protein